MNDKKVEQAEDSADDKILVSFYLPPKTFEKVDDILFYIKKRLPIEKRRRLTKSIFYETGLNILIEDYNAKGEESSLLKAILEVMQKEF